MPRTIHNQFPDYPTDALPDLSGFTDTSWHNDACPSFRKGDFLIWVDYPNPREREGFGDTQFVVQRVSDEATLLGTDDWTEVLALVR